MLRCDNEIVTPHFQRCRNVANTMLGQHNFASWVATLSFEFLLKIEKKNIILALMGRFPKRHTTSQLKNKYRAAKLAFAETFIFLIQHLNYVVCTQTLFAPGDFLG